MLACSNMEQFRPPSPLIVTGIQNIAENWRKWEQRFRLYVVASGVVAKDKMDKIAILLHTVGKEAPKLYNSFLTALVPEVNFPFIKHLNKNKNNLENGRKAKGTRLFTLFFVNE